MNLLIDLLIAALAGCQAVEVWHHGSIFKAARSWVGGCRDDESEFVSRKICELLLCPFCLSHWTCLAATAVVLFVTDPLSAWRLPVYALAVTRIAQLLNDATHGFTNSPPSDVTEIDETSDVDSFTVVDDDPV